MRRSVIVLGAVVFALLAGGAPIGHGAPQATETIKVLPDLNGTGAKTSKTVFGYKQRFKIVVTGTIREQGDDDPFTQSDDRVVDAFYCFAGKACSKVLLTRPDIAQGALQIAYTKDRYKGRVYYSLNRALYAQRLPYEKYRPDHRYEFVFECREPPGGSGNSCGQLVFRAPPGGFQNKESTYVGFYTVQITPLGEFEESPADKLVVRFDVRGTGKPNVPLKGYPNARTLVSSRVSGSGHATFTKKNATLLIATETKGSITHEDTYSDGTKHTMTFGVVSGTRYYPATRRLALVLRLKTSDDPDCQPGFLISTTFGVLTLLPHEDAAANGGTAIFFGLPKSTKTDPCRHAHGWTSSPGERVTVRILLAESTP